MQKWQNPGHGHLNHCLHEWAPSLSASYSDILCVIAAASILEYVFGLEINRYTSNCISRRIETVLYVYLATMVALDFKISCSVSTRCIHAVPRLKPYPTGRYIIPPGFYIHRKCIYVSYIPTVRPCHKKLEP